jgi:hypothetical protein
MLSFALWCLEVYDDDVLTARCAERQRFRRWEFARIAPLPDSCWFGGWRYAVCNLRALRMSARLQHLSDHLDNLIVQVAVRDDHAPIAREDFAL